MTSLEKDVSSPIQMMLSLLGGFYWFEEGLHEFIRARGWADVTRSQSIVLANIAMNVRQPSDIARRAGVSRQAIHATLKAMIESDLITLQGDPENGRAKLVTLTERGEALRSDTLAAMTFLAQQLENRVGTHRVEAGAQFLDTDWGPPIR